MDDLLTWLLISSLYRSNHSKGNEYEQLSEIEDKPLGVSAFASFLVFGFLFLLSTSLIWEILFSIVAVLSLMVSISQAYDFFFGD